MPSWRERYRITWELAWPAAAIDAGRALTFYLLAIESTSLDSVYLLVAFFLIQPWVIRRALRLPYRGFRFAVTDEEDTEPRKMSYQESLKVMWLLTWRSTLLLLAAAVPISFLFGVVLKIPLAETFRFAAGSRLGNSLGLTVVDLVAGLLFFPILIPGMIRKQYRGFRISILRPKPEAAVKVKGKAGRR